MKNPTIIFLMVMTSFSSWGQKKPCNDILSKIDSLKKKENFNDAIKHLNALNNCVKYFNPKLQDSATKVGENLLVEINKLKKRADNDRNKAVQERNRATALLWANTSDSLLPAHQLRLLFRADQLSPENSVIKEKIKYVFNSQFSNLFSEKLSFITSPYLRRLEYSFSENDKFLIINNDTKQIYSLPNFCEITKKNGFTDDFNKRNNFYFSANKKYLIVTNNNIVEFYSLDNLKKIQFDTLFINNKVNYYEIVGDSNNVLVKKIDLNSIGSENLENFFSSNGKMENFV